MVKGDKERAITNLQKSIELNPENTHAEELIRQMTTE